MTEEFERQTNVLEGFWRTIFVDSLSAQHDACTSVMAHFDERSGIVPCKTDWGTWWQTLEEVYIEVDTGKEILAKNVKCDIKPRHLTVVVNGEVLVDVSLGLMCVCVCVCVCVCSVTPLGGGGGSVFLSLIFG